MDLKELENKINLISKKYEKDKLNISDYSNELHDQFYNFSETTGNYDFEKVFGNIVCGEDCEGVVSYADPNSLYFFRDYREVEVVDYNLLTDLSKLAIKEIQKTKDFEIC